MPTDFVPIPVDNILIRRDDLKVRKAKEVATAVTQLSYFRLIDVRRLTEPTGNEAITFDIGVEVGQYHINDVRLIERIAVIFDANDEKHPEVLALRADFPRVPHLNLRPFEKPRSLCLYDLSYDEIRLRWTPVSFLERIRQWLSATAKGRLHLGDQPLEPLLLPSDTIPIVLSPGIENEADTHAEQIGITGREWNPNKYVLFAEQQMSKSSESQTPKWIAYSLRGQPQLHGVINREPSDLEELHSFLMAADIDLLYDLRQWLRSVGGDFADSHLILLLDMPRMRSPGESAEDSERWAFLLPHKIRQIGAEIGAWAIEGGQYGVLIHPDTTKTGKQIRLQALNPTSCLTRDLAAKISGRDDRECTNICLIGAGALGSQLFMNLVRMGYGKWSIVDEDCLLPHNLARHALPGHCVVGLSKARTLASQANDLVVGEPIADAIVANVLHPGSARDELDAALRSAQVVIDASTSVPVSRHLAIDTLLPARLMCTFLSPTGMDLVVLAEDVRRQVRLDHLEMQYYRALIVTPALKSHLSEGEYMPYAGSCRDVTSRIPQDLVALHAAICSRVVRQLLSGSTAGAFIWRVNTEDMSVSRFDVPVGHMEQVKLGDWTLYSDSVLMDKIHEARTQRLPNETGGVLLGSIDTHRKIIYAVETIFSPPDSTEWPTIYIRGCHGLKEKVDEVEGITGSMLGYVGEWHSHPSSSQPSEADRKVSTWLSEIMERDGLPSLMLIVGNSGHSWYLGKIPENSKVDCEQAGS